MAERKRKIKAAIAGSDAYDMCSKLLNEQVLMIHFLSLFLVPGFWVAGKPIPTELRNEEAALRHELELEDANTELMKTHVDDEYAFAGVKDPKVVITTARDPSSKLAQFAKVSRYLWTNLCTRSFNNQYLQFRFTGGQAFVSKFSKA